MWVLLVWVAGVETRRSDLAGVETEFPLQGFRPMSCMECGACFGTIIYFGGMGFGKVMAK